MARTCKHKSNWTFVNTPSGTPIKKFRTVPLRGGIGSQITEKIIEYTKIKCRTCGSTVFVRSEDLLVTETAEKHDS